MSTSLNTGGNSKGDFLYMFVPVPLSVAVALAFNSCFQDKVRISRSRPLIAPKRTAVRNHGMWKQGAASAAGRGGGRRLSDYGSMQATREGRIPAPAAGSPQCQDRGPASPACLPHTALSLHTHLTHSVFDGGPANPSGPRGLP